VSSSWPTYWCNAGGVQVEGYLEEMLLLAQRAEEYNQFMLAKMTEALAPAPLPAARHNDFRRVLTAVGRWPGLCIDSHQVRLASDWTLCAAGLAALMWRCGSCSTSMLPWRSL
jgi:hypothetical protein